MLPNQGFPALNTPLKLVNKLNNMALTISQGQHNKKIHSIIVQRPISIPKQLFRLIEKDQMKVYFIQSDYNGLMLETKSSWGDMVYSELKLGKHDKDNKQLWRVVAYNQVVYDQKLQPKLKIQEQLSTESVMEPVIQTQDKILEQKLSKTGQVTTKIYNLGYDYDSGPDVKTFIETKGTIYENQQFLQPQKSLQQVHQKFEISNPPRFSIKQNKNLRPIDLDNKGWFFIENVKFNLVLQIQGGIDQPGMSIVLNRLNGNRNQLWRFE